MRECLEKIPVRQPTKRLRKRYRAERHCALDDCCLSASKCEMVLWSETKIGFSKYKHSFWQTLPISRNTPTPHQRA